MVRKRFLLSAVPLALLHLVVSALAYACAPAEKPLAAGSAEAFAALAVAQAPIDIRNVDYALLAEAVFHETNVRRRENGLPGLAHLRELDKAACVHAEAMVEQGFFAHVNPAGGAMATPLDRVQRQGLRLRFLAENIAQVFALRYDPGTAVYLRRENGQTVFSREPGGEPLGPRTYLSLADALLDAWMNSPPHRKNILAKEPDYLGAGCQLGADNDLGMPMFDCVQLFFAPLEGP